jgi:hypothetical protein
MKSLCVMPRECVRSRGRVAVTPMATAWFLVDARRREASRSAAMAMVVLSLSLGKPVGVGGGDATTTGRSWRQFVS